MGLRRILIADDDEDAATSLAGLLTLKGYEAAVVFDAAAALVAAGEAAPDALLIEIGMEGMAGLGVCRRLRAAPRGAELLIVAMSAWTRPRDRANAYAAGCNVFLLKPLELDVLDALLGGSQGRRCG